MTPAPAPPPVPTRYTASSPIDTDCYSAAASTACSPTNAPACTCASDNTFSSSSTANQIAAARDSVITLWDKKVCATTFVATLKIDAAALKVLVDALDADMLTLQSAIGSAQGAMGPVVENIDALYSAGSCAFARRRINGILQNTCGDVLAGVSALGVSLLLIGISLYMFLFLLHNCVIARFRMYDVGCWKHDRTEGCCAKDNEYSDMALKGNAAASIEMVNPYSGATSGATRSSRQ